MDGRNCPKTCRSWRIGSTSICGASRKNNERNARSMTEDREKQSYERLVGSRQQIQTELSKVIVGQREVIEQILIALLAGGHCLITGAPGLAKTLLVKSIAQVFDLQFRRIQFTPDLMPADITGTEILSET